MAASPTTLPSAHAVSAELSQGVGKTGMGSEAEDGSAWGICESSYVLLWYFHMRGRMLLLRLSSSLMDSFGELGFSADVNEGEIFSLNFAR